MKQEIINYILGEVTIPFLIAFYFFALFGVILSMMLHYKRREKKEKFNRKYWVADNLLRLLTSIFCIFFIVRFFDQLPINLELNMFLAVVIGASMDQIIIMVRNKTKLNIFQKIEK